MGEFFSNIYGAQFPDVVFNSGPLPPSGGLPAPLHDTADGRINYNSTLLGDLNPYAYGEPGYQSSQSAFLNIPHRVQKIVPVLHLPEAKQATSGETFELSHPVDDSDVAFVLRLNRNSMFCTGLKNATFSRMGLSTQVDPLVNLCTLNYLLSGIQLGIPAGGHVENLWYELLNNMDAARFSATRDLATSPISFKDLQHVVRHCVRPLGIVRGSEKQGGQNEVTQSPATWPVCFVTTLVLDGKEANTLNLWHHHGISAGDDLALCLKPMPIKQYTLNHYYKRVVRQRWAKGAQTHVWQLVPTTFHLDVEDDAGIMPPNWRTNELWQERGYWHIGRAQVMAPKYGLEDYYADDMANQLKTHHLDMTFQPMFCKVKGAARAPPSVVRGVLTARPPAPPRPLLFDRLTTSAAALGSLPRATTTTFPRSSTDSLPRATTDSSAQPPSTALDSLLAPPTALAPAALAEPAKTTQQQEGQSQLGKRAGEVAADRKKNKRNPTNSLEGTLLRPDGTQEGGVSMAML